MLSYHGYCESKYRPISIFSIRTICSARDYKEVIQAFNAFDNILSDNYVEVIMRNIPESAPLTMQHLLNDKTKHKFEPFIYETFRIYCDKKKEIKFNYETLDKMQNAD